MENFEIAFNEIPENVSEYDFVGIAIPNYEVKAKNFNRLDDVIKILRPLGVKGKEKLIISFSGYSDTTDEVYVIQEIRDYVKALFERHSFIFYYLSSQQMTKTMLFACLSDLQSSKPIDCKTIRNLAFDNQPVSNVKIVFRPSEDLLKDIIYKTVDYAFKIGDTAKEAKRIVNEIMTSAPQNCSPPTPENFDLLDSVERFNNLYWAAFTKKGFNKIIKSDRIRQFLTYDSKFAIANGIDLISSNLATLSGLKTNVFIINDLAYGGICDGCGTDRIIVIVNSRPLDDLDKKIFVPSYETYMAKRILPSEHRYMNEFPVAVLPDVDQWYCPKCNQLHTFRYNESFGLLYHPENP